MKKFIKMYYPIIIIAVISLLLGGFIQQEIIYQRFESQLPNVSKDTKINVIYGNCQKCH